MEREYEPTQSRAANVLGVHRRTLIEWIERGAPDKTLEGYDIGALRAWADLNSRVSAGPGWSDDEGDIDGAEYKQRLEMAKLRKMEGEAAKVNAEAELKAFLAKQTTQDVVHLDDVEQFLALFFGEARRVLMRIPQEMKNGYPEAIRRDLEDDLQSRLAMALRTISGYARRVTDLREGK